MSKQLQNIGHVDPTTTRVDIAGSGGRLSLAGPAIAVVALVAVLGMIWVCGKLIDMSAKAIPSPQPTMKTSP
jgi:hypothetical protein